MSNSIANKDIINKFREEFQNSDIINLNKEESAGLELITPSYNTFFDMLFSEKKFQFETFFDYSLSSDDGMIDFNGNKILRKKTYAKENLAKYLLNNELGFDKITTTTIPLYQNDILAKFVNQDDIFLSYGNLYYQLTGEKTISVAPLVFFKVKISLIGNKFFLNLDYNSPLYNFPLIDLIKRKYKVDIGNNSEGFDYFEYIKNTEQLTKKLLFAVDDSINIHQKDVFHWVKIKHLLDVWPKLSSSLSFRCLEETIEPDKDSIYNSHSDYPKYIMDGLNLLHQNSIVKIAKIDPLSKTYIEAVVEEYILNRKNVVIISSTKEGEKKVKQSINTNYYDVFIPYKDFSKPNIAMFNYFEAVKNHTNIIVDSNAMMNREEIRENISEHKYIDSELKSISIPTGENSLEAFESYYKYYCKSTKLYEFEKDSDYEYEDYLADKLFLDSIDGLDEIGIKPFIFHPFYGLNSTIKKEEYENIMEFLNGFIKDIEEFNKNINESEVKISKWSDFNSIRDYDDSETLLSIFSEYEAFPLEYFDVDFTDDLLTKLELLKEYYRLEASMKLSIDMVCRPVVWTKDFTEIIEKVSTGRGEMKIRKEFKSIMKINANRHNFRALVVLFNKYLINIKNKEEIFPELNEIFHEKSTNIDGLVSIEKAYDFIKSYNRNIMLYSKYNFDNEFTYKIFHDKNFLDAYKKKYYSSLNLSRSVFEHDLDLYHKYFNEDKFDYISASFTEIIEKFKFKLNASKKDFEEYLDFAIMADESSMQLRDALDEVEENQENLVNFKNNYLTSLYKFLLSKEFDEKQGLKLSEDNSKNTFQFYRLINNNPTAIKLDVVKSFSAARKNLLEIPSYNQTITALKEKYHYKKLYSTRDAIKICGDEFFHLYPLYSTNTNKVDILGKYQFDLAIIYLNDKTSLLDIYNAITLGKNCIIVNPVTNQFDHVKNLNLNLKKDLVKYDLYGGAPQVFKDRFEAALVRQGIQLIKDKVIDTNVVIPYYYEKYNQKYAMRFEPNYKELSDGDIYDIPALLYSSYGIKTVFQYPINFMLYEDLNIMSMYKDVKEYIDNEANFSEKNIENMSYDQKKKYKYFEMLTKIDDSFEYYVKAQETSTEIAENKLTRSKISERPIINISYLEIANGIITYLEHFTYLNRDVLLNHIANIVGTDNNDVDFRLLFAKAENYLISDHIIAVQNNRLGLVRE
jgi:hypothetical protein